VRTLNTPCPYCGQETLYLPDGWTLGGPAVCSNKDCDSNLPGEDR
jgi:hypothetical protein